MLLERKVLQFHQVPANIVRQQTFSVSDEVLAQSRPASPQIPGRVCQLVIVQLRQQTPVVVKHRSHPPDLQSLCIKQNSEVAVMAVGIQDDGVQYAHPPERISAANAIEIGQQLRYGTLLPAEDCASFCKPHSLTGKERTFADQLLPVKVHVVGHCLAAQPLR